MGFSTHLGFELFNDCLYYRRQALDLIEKDEVGNAFGIRRALRSSFVCLSMYWESRLNNMVQNVVTQKLFETKKVPRLEDHEVKRFDRFARSDIGLKFQFLELLTGVDFTVNKQVEQIQRIRNDILHKGHYDWSLTNEDFLSKLGEAITETRRFFAALAEKGLTSKDKFLMYEEPVDMTKLGYGHSQSNTARKPKD
ncbi:MAG: hypothetical protein JRN03_06085 [Nitrososphaerota archaeon]|nr:hypothetical protein [Nitrososphaerota archaeon]